MLSSTSNSPLHEGKKTKTFISPNHFAVLASDVTGDDPVFDTASSFRDDTVVSSPHTTDRRTEPPASLLYIRNIINFSAFKNVLIKTVGLDGFTLPVHNNDPINQLPVNRLELRDRIRAGPYRPIMESYPKTMQGASERSFQKSWFEKYVWLEYSPSKDLAFCFPCRIFKGNNLNSSQLDDAFSKTGFCSWYRGINHFNKHQITKSHIFSTQAMADYLNTTSIDQQIDISRKEYISKCESDRLRNREIMKRLIDITLCFVKGGRPFRGHDEGEKSNQKGLFKEIVNTFAKYEIVLKEHFENGPKNAKYTSNRIQNDLITDETSDVGHHEQFSIVIRYFDDQMNRPVETFLDLVRLVSVNAESIFTAIKNSKRNANILYVHCYAHCLNLSLIDSITSNTRSVQFLYSFIEGSPTRHAIFENIAKEHGSNLQTLKSCSTTRWACRSEAVNAIKHNYRALLKALDKITEKSLLPDVKMKGLGLKSQIKSFNFIFCMNMMQPILQLVLKVSSSLQTPKLDLLSAVKHIQSLKSSLISMRDSYDEFELIFKNTENVYNATQTRHIFKTKFDEMRVNVCNTTLDTLINGLDLRFKQETLDIINIIEFDLLNKYFHISKESLISEITLLKQLEDTPKVFSNINDNLIFQLLDVLGTNKQCKVEIFLLEEQHSRDVNDLSSCNNNNETQQLNEYESSDLNLFTRPSTANFAKYWLFHPNQPKIRNRKWVSLRSIDKSLFCCICLCYGDRSGPFSKGFIDWKHVYTRINEHENSKTHRLNKDAHVMKKQFSSIDSLLTYGHILFCIIDIIKLIGKRGLSYRGKTNEAIYTFDNPALDHGNFLEMILLVDKYDPVLKAHLDKAIKNSTKSHDSGSKQEGGHICFLSKTTVNYVIEIISEIIKSSISEEIIKAGMYSVQLDTTQDVSVIDQCSVIIRYVNGISVKERLVGMIKCKSNKRIAFVDLVLKVFHNLNIKANNCVGNATDGAANMQGQYNEFSAKLSNVAAIQIHVWCYAHVLSLVIGDITLKVLQSITLFGILNGCAVFERESHTRIGIETNSSIKSKARFKARGFRQDLRKCTLEFSRTKDAADKFVRHTNKMFQKMKNNVIDIANSLPQSRKKKKTKQFHDYEADDDPITDPLHSYEVNVYNQVLDTVIESISSRFKAIKILRFSLTVSCLMGK
ncbi:hypothetical protein QTP88_016764 [Uroleucon formosanum]